MLPLSNLKTIKTFILKNNIIINLNFLKKNSFTVLLNNLSVKQFNHKTI